MPSFSRLLNRGFTLLEVLVTLAILLMVLVTVIEFMAGIDQAWKSAAADPFAEAQNAFETVAQNLASATLASYQDYADSSGAFRTGATFVPDHLARRSDLDFVCGPGRGRDGRVTSGSGVFFLAPNGYTQTYAHAGMERLLNAMGYFVEFGDDETAPGFVPGPLLALATETGLPARRVAANFCDDASFPSGLHRTGFKKLSRPEAPFPSWPKMWLR